jgi:UDP-2,4-diacetamido-2,4,6-trideoxy-beta-L-altropyranose hydrolase
VPGSVLFRCDSSPSIGAGHVTRCRALAIALRARGADVCFVARAGTKVDGFPIIAAPPGPDGELSDADLERTTGIALSGGHASVVVDHYGARASYFEGLKAAGLTLAVVDDVADRDLNAADWIVNQNLAAPRLVYKAREGATLLLGPRYALLRPEFGEARASLERRFSPDDRRVLVTFGGGRTAELCASLLDALEKLERPLEVRCIATDASSALEDVARSSPHHVEVFQGAADMTAQMAWCDLSVNAGGSTCWELCCLGVPMIVVALDGDQRQNPPALEEAGVAVAVDSFEAAAGFVRTLLDEPARRAAMSQVGMALVDGEGAARVADLLGQVAHARRETARAEP